MPRLRIAVSVLLGLVLTSCGAFRTAAAVVNGRTVEEESFRRKLDFLTADPRFASQFPGQQGREEKKNLARQLLTFLIHQEVIEAYAGGRNVSVGAAAVERRLSRQIEEAGGRARFDRQIATSEASIEDVRDLLRAQVLREEVARRVVSEEVPEERLREEYEKRKGEFTQVRAAHILVADRALAARLARQATPKNFASLAEEHSEDPGSKDQGGDLGARPASEYVEPFDKAVLEIPVGEVGGPIQTDFGWHVIHVIARSERPFEEVRDRLAGEFGQEFFTDWLLSRVRAADILVNPRYGDLDPRSGEVVERRATTPQAPEVQVTP